MSVFFFTEMEMDAIGEISNICLGSSASTLSMLVRQTVDITPPRVEIIEKNEYIKNGHGEGTALISRAYIKDDAFRLGLAACQRSIIQQGHILGAHRLGGFHLIDKLQVSIVRHIQHEALAILAHRQFIGGGRRSGRAAQLGPGIQVGYFERRERST